MFVILGDCPSESLEFWLKTLLLLLILGDIFSEPDSFCLGFSSTLDICGEFFSITFSFNPLTPLYQQQWHFAVLEIKAH